MTPEIYLLLVEYGRERERDALDTLVPTVRRMFPGGPLHTVVIDNARTGADPPALDERTDRISGDNALHEFSGWDRGLAWMQHKHRPDPGAIVVLANDTVARADKVERVRSLPADRAAGALHGALVGWIDEYPRSVRLFEMEWRQWVDTSLVLTTWRTLAALAPLAAPLDDRQLFDHDWRRIFKEPSPLSDNYRTYLRTYFVGDCMDAEFNHGWYAQAPVTAANFDALKIKLRCVFCEHLLSARARALGIPLVDIRPQALPIDPFPIEVGLGD